LACPQRGRRGQCSPCSAVTPAVGFVEAIQIRFELKYENTMDKPMSVCVLVGSLRKASFNRMLANALISLAPSSLKLDIVEVGQLPFYNEDL
jgi:hypothetical protein